MSMSKKIKIVLASLGFAGGAVALAVPALAGVGYSSSSSVVRVTGNWADGVLAATRASPDSIAYQLCTVYTTASSEHARCSARDTAGDYLTCYTSDPRFIAAIRSVQPESRLYFRAASGYCDWVEVHMDSARLQ